MKPSYGYADHCTQNSVQHRKTMQRERKCSCNGKQELQEKESYKEWRTPKFHTVERELLSAELVEMPSD